MICKLPFWVGLGFGSGKSSKQLRRVSEAVYSVINRLNRVEGEIEGDRMGTGLLLVVAYTRLWIKDLCIFPYSFSDTTYNAENAIIYN